MVCDVGSRRVLRMLVAVLVIVGVYSEGLCGGVEGLEGCTY